MGFQGHNKLSLLWVVPFKSNINNESLFKTLNGLQCDDCSWIQKYSNQLKYSNDHYKFLSSPIGDGVKFYTGLLILCFKKVGNMHKLHYVEE